MTHAAPPLDFVRHALPGNVLQHYATGRWGFVGNVHPDLAYVDKTTGEPATAEQLANARHAGPRMAGVRAMTWPTEADALAAATAAGATVSQIVR